MPAAGCGRTSHPASSAGARSLDRARARTASSACRSTTRASTFTSSGRRVPARAHCSPTWSAKTSQLVAASSVVEPKGDLVQDVLARIPPNRTEDVVVLDPTRKRLPGRLEPAALTRSKTRACRRSSARCLPRPLGIELGTQAPRHPSLQLADTRRPRGCQPLRSSGSAHQPGGSATPTRWG